MHIHEPNSAPISWSSIATWIALNKKNTFKSVEFENPWEAIVHWLKLPAWKVWYRPPLWHSFQGKKNVFPAHSYCLHLPNFIYHVIFERLSWPGFLVIEKHYQSQKSSPTNEIFTQCTVIQVLFCLPASKIVNNKTCLPLNHDMLAVMLAVIFHERPVYTFELQSTPTSQVNTILKGESKLELTFEI